MSVLCLQGFSVEHCAAGLDFTVKSLLGPCPDKEVLCGVGQADEGLRECGDTDCSAAGECLRGRCHCHVGYVGEHCGLRVCTNDEECGVGKVQPPVLLDTPPQLPRCKMSAFASHLFASQCSDVCR